MTKSVQVEGGWDRERPTDLPVVSGSAKFALQLGLGSRAEQFDGGIRNALERKDRAAEQGDKEEDSAL